jgi:hypothetical protein
MCVTEFSNLLLIKLLYSIPQTSFHGDSSSDKAETTKSIDANLSVKHHKFGSTVVVVFRALYSYGSLRAFKWRSALYYICNNIILNITFCDITYISYKPHAYIQYNIYIYIYSFSSYRYRMNLYAMPVTSMYSV